LKRSIHFNEYRCSFRPRKRKLENMEAHTAPSPAVLPGKDGFAGLIGESNQMHHLYELIGKLDHNSSPVLLHGETGTGKEMVARAIHSTGLRRNRHIVPIDCSSLTPTLIESELFGHVRGAFTGADRPKQGLLQAATGGTVFLDEIGELPMFLQAKLLRVLQEMEIRPVGSTEQIPIDVRVIAATHRDLEAGIKAGTFRQDLYFRLNVVQIKLPALRHRKVDIPLLVSHFLAQFDESQAPVRIISDDALRRLMAYDWPGNVRELANAIESAAALSDSNILTANDFAAIKASEPTADLLDLGALVPLAELERRAILNALRETGGDKLAAAHFLGIGKTTLYRKLREFRGWPPG
jgi:DNA-binding NtrC family response regulator